jgi:hypothetical protein
MLRTNNHARDLLYWCELSDAERLELDYVDDGDETGPRFFRYKGAIYDTHEFTRIDRPGHRTNPYSMTVWDEDDPLLAFDGFQSDSFFSGVAIRYCDDYERVVVATLMV